jgi:hypothetical protein
VRVRGNVCLYMVFEAAKKIQKEERKKERKKKERKKERRKKERKKRRAHVCIVSEAAKRATVHM